MRWVLFVLLLLKVSCPSFAQIEKRKYTGTYNWNKQFDSSGLAIVSSDITRYDTLNISIRFELDSFYMNFFVLPYYDLINDSTGIADYSNKKIASISYAGRWSLNSRVRCVSENQQKNALLSKFASMSFNFHESDDSCTTIYMYMNNGNVFDGIFSTYFVYGNTERKMMFDFVMDNSVKHFFRF